MWKALMAIGLSSLAVVSVATVAQAQYNRGQGYNPLEDFLRGMESRQGNSDLTCNVQHRLDRRGDIRWIRVDCSADRRNQYGR